ncbi:MAG TPA: hypothetical protein VFM10_09285 [Terriglobales bacterium]|jgi:hypothetical protein|nr:hypothetical protein [Terriglobales bacterium]
MSYDLFFCRTDPNPLRTDEVASWASKYQSFNQAANGQLWYANESTGVYFSLNLDGPVKDVSLDLPTGIRYTGLSFNMNYNRPTFFAYEAMPVVEDLARTLGLLICNPQTGSSEPRPADVHSLIENWSITNRSAVVLAAESQQDKPLEQAPFMPLADSLRWWQYQFRRSALEAELMEQDVFVPNIFLLRRAGSRRVQTAITWTPGVAMLVPEVDWGVVVRERKRFMRPPKQEVGYVRGSVLMELAREYLQDFDTKASCHLLPAKNVPAVNQILDSIELKHRLSEFVRVSVDEFQDVVEPTRVQ